MIRVQRLGDAGEDFGVPVAERQRARRRLIDLGYLDAGRLDALPDAPVVVGAYRDFIAEWGRVNPTLAFPSGGDAMLRWAAILNALESARAPHAPRRTCWALIPGATALAVVGIAFWLAISISGKPQPVYTTRSRR